MKRRVLSFLSTTPAFSQTSRANSRATPAVNGVRAPNEVSPIVNSGGTSAAQDPLPTFQPASFFAKLAALPGVGAAAAELLPRLFVVYALATDPETPAWAKALACGTLAYFVLPWDVIPDVVPVVGFADDALVATMAFERLAGLISPRVARRGREMYEKSDVRRKFRLP